MRQKYIGLAALIAVVGLAACAGGGSATSGEDPNLPPWLNEIMPEGVVWGVGSANFFNDHDSRSVADQALFAPPALYFSMHSITLFLLNSRFIRNCVNCHSFRS
jgi:hypothetical protein